MTFTPKPSTYGGINEETLKKNNFVTAEAGPQYLFIEHAQDWKKTYNEDGPKDWFDVTFRSTYNDAKFRIRNFMKNKDGTLSYMSVHWLNMLGYACCGVKTALDPEDLVGCVVLADVSLEPDWKNRKQYEDEMQREGASTVPLYPQINADSFEPVTENTVKECKGRPDQFFIPDE